jgi:hypothetical protein
MKAEESKHFSFGCLHTNQIPSKWPELFNTSPSFYVYEDFTKTNFYHKNPLQLSEAPILSPNQREESSPHQREAPSPTQSKSSSITDANDEYDNNTSSLPHNVH